MADAANNNADTTEKQKRLRPNEGQRFPFIPLPKALERARELYTLTNTHDVAMKAVIKHWGYGDKSSGGIQTVAALKSFGLVEDMGSNETRKIKLSEMALKIIKDPREISPDRDALVKQAALLPPIHREIISKYSGLPPSDDAFKAYLLLDKGMKDDSAVAFSKEFTATMSFAKISDSAMVSEVAEDENTQNSGNKSQNPPPPTGNKMVNQQKGEQLMDGERIVFTEETQPNEYLRLIASGEINRFLLEALDDFVIRQRKRLGITAANDSNNKPH